ncbi:BON domain-containing protein [Gloeothece verrucosa]|uniref:Transport-associated protein n=1 Tax=Gloeothece verrucosa (strain PCC 7822) TaxID=497965 RepID=E0ULU7_GLOV7|nr:BON domain-containing protein [Gloeothece verrucosa]ADN17927.1 transport-associated protein [Gloeothece verrucosa PCC 7822]
MNKFTLLILSSFLIIGAVGCSNVARTSRDAPTTLDGSVQNPQDVRETREDAESKIRQAQLNADIRAREERNQWSDNELERTDADLQSEVRAKLEANIPRGQLTVKAEDGVVTIVGVVPNQKEYQTIEPLAKEIKGVKAVNVNVEVVPPTPTKR